MECFLSAGQGDLGTTWGLHPSPPGCISAQSGAPCMAPSLLLAVWGMNQLSQLVKSRTSCFHALTSGNRVTACPALLSRGPGSSLYKHCQPVRAEGTGMV